MRVQGTKLRNQRGTCIDEGLGYQDESYTKVGQVGVWRTKLRSCSKMKQEKMKQEGAWRTRLSTSRDPRLGGILKGHRSLETSGNMTGYLCQS